jgi:pectate lyase
VNFRYETSDGTKREEEAQLKNPGTENEAIVVRGTISWVRKNTYKLNLKNLSNYTVHGFAAIVTLLKILKILKA